jgi:ankyrin repeat protein
LLPIHFAAACGHAATIQLLLKYGANPFLKTQKGGLSVMHFAAQ